MKLVWSVGQGNRNLELPADSFRSRGSKQHWWLSIWWWFII